MTAKIETDNYDDLMAQANALIARAGEIKKAERAAALADVKARIKQHGFTPAELGIKTAATAVTVATAKYRGPEGETWNGGSGRKPTWVQAVIDAGGDIEQYKVA